MSHYNSYQEWYEAITVTGGITLSQEYCEERIATYENEESQETKRFLNLYGEKHRQQIIGWFQKALSEL